jgi:hypothetical protein
MLLLALLEVKVNDVALKLLVFKLAAFKLPLMLKSPATSTAPLSVALLPM